MKPIFSDKFHFFKNPKAEKLIVSEKFTFPFSYTPDALSLLAMEELQNYLENQNDFNHPFFEQENKNAIGKMFGVLVVENQQKQKGFLAAFSGKLANSNSHPFFVPPVFDMLTEKSFFLKEEEHLNDLNAKIKNLEENQSFKDLQHRLEHLKNTSNHEIENKKSELKRLKSQRKSLREKYKKELTILEYQVFEEDLIKQSLRDKHELNVLKAKWQQLLEGIINEINSNENKIDALKQKRKKLSSGLQKRLFKNYVFLNARGEQKSLLAIFQEHVFELPPAGAGECCAPKLLHFAYSNHLKPLSMAEFWWGASPKSEVRHHKQFYPACWGKCLPILSHMLKGLNVDDNPLIKNTSKGKELEILYQDPWLVVVNKPAEFLSVPGIHVQDSVYTRIKEKFPNATGPLIVHRLDMSTSGVLLLAKTKEVHKALQQQFISREVKKRYAALLDGILDVKNGEISLPLRLDINDRPRQMVCQEYGKQATTFFQVVTEYSNKTLVYFYPITGRTHQLRVHAAHSLGLNCPIVGDDLYGKSSDRLYLHANVLEFTHPISKEQLKIEAKIPF